MAINELLERSTIQFPKDLKLEEAEDLIRYIARYMDAAVSYLTSSHNSVRKDNKKLVEDKGTVYISGSINNKKGAFDCFETKPADNTSKIAAIQFSLIPGYEIEEYNQTTIKLWDDVRDCVKKYFSKR